MKMPADRFIALALKTLPIGHRFGVVETRDRVAQMFESELKKEVSAQLPVTIQEVTQRINARKDLLDQLASSYDEMIKVFEQEKAAFKTIVAGHLELLNAVEAWHDWCAGQGTVDQQGDLWEAVKVAMQQYRSLRK